jgi:hypothetical protein
MKEQVLLFHFEDAARRSALRKAIMPLHIGCKLIPEEEWDAPLGAFVGLGTTPRQEPEGAELTDEVVLFCGLSDLQLQLALGALRKAGLTSPYKATLTPTNKDWSVRQLFGELYQEHQMLTGAARAAAPKQEEKEEERD